MGFGVEVGLAAVTLDKGFSAVLGARVEGLESAEDIGYGRGLIADGRGVIAHAESA